MSNKARTTSEIVTRTAPEIVHSDDTFRASNGVVIKLKRVSQLLVAEAGRKIVLPRPPSVFLEDKGRSEENPNDPDYLDALTNAKYDRAMAAITIMLAMGTKVIEAPADLAPEEDEEWFEIVESQGINILPGNKRMRYAAWLKYVVLNSPDDFNGLIRQMARLNGLTLEQDVGEAEESFRGSAERDAITQYPTRH